MKKNLILILILIVIAGILGPDIKAQAAACNSSNLFLATQGDILWGDGTTSSDISASTGSTVRLLVSGEDGCAGQSVTFQIVGGATFTGNLKLGKNLTGNKYQLYYDWNNNLPNGNYKFKTVLPSSSSPSQNNLAVTAAQTCNISKVYANPNGGVQGSNIQLILETKGACDTWTATINVWDSIARKAVWPGSSQALTATSNKLEWTYALPTLPTGTEQGIYYFEAHLGTQNLRSSTFIDCKNPGSCGVASIPPISPVAPIDSVYNLLAPLPNPDGGEITSYNTDDANNIGKYLNTMIRIFIGLCAVVAVVMIVIGGMEYMLSELAHTKEHGKERITGAVLGLLIALGAYALLFTINPDILKTDLASLTTAELSVTEQQVQQYTGKGMCQPITDTSNPCSPGKLAAAGFASGIQASSICRGESGGQASLPSGVDVCKDGNSFSFGLFQVNILAHANEIPGGVCSGIFTKNGSGTQGACLEKNGSICIKYDCQVTNSAKYQSCKSYITNPTNNIAYAAALRAARSWDQWGANKSCHFN